MRQRLVGTNRKYFTYSKQFLDSEYYNCEYIGLK